MLRQGNTAASRLASVFWLPNNSEASRVALITSKKLGKACQRNRLRRRLREILRAECSNALPHADIVVIARPPAAEVEFAALREQIRGLLKRAGLCPRGQANERND